MILLGEHLAQGKSKRGGWSRYQVEILGLKWPLRKGWKSHILGQDFPEALIKEFIASKDAHVKCKGVPPTPEQLARRREFAKKRKAFISKRGLMARDAWSKKTRVELLGKDNAAEQHIDQLLSTLPFKFRREHPLNIEGKKYFIDFLVSSVKEGQKRKKKIRLAIEIDGGYHFTHEQQASDRRKEADMMATCRVWSILRIEARKALEMDAAGLWACVTSMSIGEIRKVGY